MIKEITRKLYSPISYVEELKNKMKISSLIFRNKIMCIKKNHCLGFAF